MRSATVPIPQPQLHHATHKPLHKHARFHIDCTSRIVYCHSRTTSVQYYVTKLHKQLTCNSDVENQSRYKFPSTIFHNDLEVGTLHYMEIS